MCIWLIGMCIAHKHAIYTYFQSSKEKGIAQQKHRNMEVNDTSQGPNKIQENTARSSIPRSHYAYFHPHRHPKVPLRDSN